MLARYLYTLLDNNRHLAAVIGVRLFALNRRRRRREH